MLLNTDFTFYFNYVVLLLFFHNSNGRHNCPSVFVVFWWEKIKGNLRRTNKEPSMDFRRANTELSMDFRKADTESSMHFRRANTDTYQK